jgi:DNA-binding transcriptional LysR family regulator
MNIRHLRYFVTLAREGHHARAAAACSVTQPTLSEAIRQLERELAVPLIARNGQRYRGLTPEGKRALVWAQRILADEEALAQELAEVRNGLSGELRFGVIPAAIPVTPFVTEAFCRDHPQVLLRIYSQTSIEIQRGLDAGELEAGFTYLENEPLRNASTHLLYREHYMLLTPAGGPFDKLKSVRWRDAGKVPLCLLSRNMQNRRIMDAVFARAGVPSPNVVMETDSVLALIAYVRSGGWSSIVPHTFLTLLGTDKAVVGGLRAIPMADPRATQAIGLVVSDREPLAPVARVFLASVRKLDVPGALMRRLPKGTA